MTFKLGRKTLILWQIRVLVVCVILIALIMLFFRYSVYVIIPALLVLIAGIATLVWYLPALFRKQKIDVGENSIIVTRGVFVVTSHIMPYRRLVFAGGYSTPLARVFGLKGVILRAARASVVIPEIEDFEADKLIFALGGEKKND